jgi:hypothetical protein
MVGGVGPTLLIPKVPFVIFDFVLGKKLQILFLETSLPVMVLLISNIRDQILFLRFADTECTTLRSWLLHVVPSGLRKPSTSLWPDTASQ